MLYSYRRKVKIVCTLGPASSTPETLGKLIKAGLDVARLNFSHGTHEFHKNQIEIVRRQAREHSKSIALMQDLQGPKIRAGTLPSCGELLNSGDVLLLSPQGATPGLTTHGRKLIPISAEIAGPIADSVRVGARILFDDGKIATRVVEVRSPEIVVEVENGGLLTSNKGMNLPGTPLSIPCLTEKDLNDLKFGLAQGVDAVALSFVRSAEDVEILRKLLQKATNDPPLVISKIEREEAIECQEAIIEASDGLLVARGDMAVEIGAERVPTVQKQLIQGCNRAGVPIITATQMLESMISCPTPTRAEASDVANAVFDGTDAVMLSGESASGQYPVQAVETMARIVLEAERACSKYSRHDSQPLSGSVVDAIEHSASQIATQVGAIAIACLTHSGMAARTLAKFRPDPPIVAIMDDEASLRKLAFCWGIRGVMIQGILATDDLFSMVEDVLQKNHWAQAGDLVVVTAGIPSLRRGTTNMVKVHRVGVPSERQPKGPIMVQPEYMAL